MPSRILHSTRELTRDQKRAFIATFLGWMFDGFDFTVLTFILVDIQHTFAIDAVLAGALGTVTLVMRLAGGVVSGAMADKWGRKLPLMLSITWLSIFAFLSGFSTSYTMLFALRALFGIGMGGVWAAAGRLRVGLHPRGVRVPVRLSALRRRVRLARDVEHRDRPDPARPVD